MNLYIRVHTKPSETSLTDLVSSTEYFDSAPTDYPTINPKFELDEMCLQGSFRKSFNEMTSNNVIIELKSEQDESFSVPFKVDFSKLRYIGDTLTTI